MKLKRFIVQALPILAFIAFFGVLASGSRLLSYPDLGIFSLRISIPLLAAYLVMAWCFFRQKVISLTECLIASILSMLVFPAGGLGAVAAANVCLDTGKPIVRSVTISEKKEVVITPFKSSSQHSFIVIVPSWRPGQAHEEITVTKDEYDHAVLGHTAVSIHTRPGRLGFEWIESYEMKHGCQHSFAPAK